MHYQGDLMYFSDYSARDLGKKFGTPLYVYEEKVILRQAAKLLSLCDDLPLDIYYACKANTNLSLMTILRHQGLNVDCVSRGEILAAFRAGYPRERISFTGNNVSENDMLWILEQGIELTLDSVDQVARLGRLSPGERIGVRLNHMGAGHHEHVITGGPDSKFGVVPADYEALFEEIGRYNLKLIGIHQHIGSGISQVEDWLMAVEILLDCLPLFPDLDWVDFGGGLGVPYAPEDQEVDLHQLSQGMKKMWQKASPNSRTRMRIQPGRFLVADCGFLLMEVQSIKRSSKHLFVGTDSGLHYHIRHPLYRAYHPIFNATGGGRKIQTMAVTGNICESGDLFTHGRDVPEAKLGDILVLAKAGAYGFSMASRYNSRPLPAEILIREGKEPLLIRRRECYDSLLENQEGYHET
jgi:diaminopimelate decarboxylase